MRRARLNLAILLCCAAFVCAGLRAQTPKVAPLKPGSLNGEVVNAKGAPVAGAQILWQAADGGTPHVLHSDAQGHFRIDPLRPGLYELRASAGGTWSEWEHNVIVRPGTEAVVKLRLSFKTPAVAPNVELKGAMRTWDVLVSGALPHDSAGEVWYEESAASANKLVRFNPSVEIFTVFPMPAPDSAVRNMVRDARGRLWMPIPSLNKIAVVE